MRALTGYGPCCKDGHELWNEWLTLSDQKGRRQGSQGQLCVCVTVLRSSDTPIAHGDAASDDEGPKAGAAPSDDNVAGPDTCPLSQLNLSSCVPVTNQLIPLIHSDMLKLSWKGD